MMLELNLMMVKMMPELNNQMITTMMLELLMTMVVCN
jgi:hypothetical protein